MIELTQLATNPQSLLKRGTELTVIFSESEVPQDLTNPNLSLNVDEITFSSDPSDNSLKRNKIMKNICAKCHQEYSDLNETCYYHPGKLLEAETKTRSVHVKRMYQVSQITLFISDNQLKLDIHCYD